MKWYENIPVNINNNGDPLVDNQVINTVEKIKLLEGYKNILHICTKAIPSEKAYELLNSLTENQKQNLFVSYSLTGLNEGNYSFEQRIEAIERLYSILGDITILLRPLIKGRNDSKENIERIVKISSKYGNRIILGGLHSKELIKQLDDETYNFFINCCKENKVKYFNKTSCAVSDKFNIPCKVHDYNKSQPKNLQILDLLGYKYEIINGIIVLDQASNGDLNLVRFITESMPETKKLTSILNKISTNDYKNYEVTSGWFSWSDNKPCPIHCDYCVMNQIDYLESREKVGCHPKDLENIRIDNKDKPAVLIKTGNISYKNTRKQVDCIKY